MDIDASQIYIVKPNAMVRPVSRENNSYPNFVMGNKGASTVDSSRNMSDSLSNAMTSVAVGTSLVSLPMGLLFGAIAGGGVIAAKIIRDKSSLQTPIDETEKKEIQEFLFNHGVTISIAKELGFIFPPGHPKVDMLYKRHPLAEVAGANKENVYIPHDKYDEILMAEREAELLKLLVYLGATKITITNNMSRSGNSKVKGNIAGGSAVVGNAEVGFSNTTEDKSSSLDKRVFSLAGKKWNERDTLDRKKFSWVDFEPSWEALIVAREVGGCTKAALDIREHTSFSDDKSILAKVEYAVYSGLASADIKSGNMGEKVYLVEAEFCSIQTSAQHNETLGN